MSAYEELVQVPDPVRVYDWNGTTWDQRGTIQITGNVDTRAMAMSADGDAVAIQTITNDVPNDDDQQTSSVTVYLWDGTVWTSRPIAANVSSRTYGGNLAISDQGTFLAVADKSTSGNGGFVELYRWGGSTYTQTFMWSGSDGDLFVGETLAMTPSGSALALSMARSNYERVVLHVSLIDGVQQAVTTIDTVFQMSVSLSISDNGATLATGHQSAGNVSVWGAGEVTVWNVSNGSVTQLGGTLTIADSAMFGFNVALSGNGLVLAAYSITDSNNTGQVHLLQYTGGAWDLLETFSEEGGTWLYGTAIALSYNGGVCVVGDRLASSSGNVEVGVVRVYGDDASWDTTEGGSAIPCFHGDTIIALADGTVVRVADMVAGMVVRDIHGRAQAVRRVIRRQQADCVYFQPDALAPGVPDRTLLVTPNHLLRHPDGRVMPAGALVAALEEMQRRRAVRVRAGGARVMHRTAARCGRILRPLTVYHIAVDRWSLVRVHNLWAETMVQTVADDRRRQRCVRR